MNIQYIVVVLCIVAAVIFLGVRSLRVFRHPLQFGQKISLYRKYFCF
jgi:hypothetical protein